MYFNEKKEDTNIDSEFKENRKINLDFSQINFKKIFIIIGIIAVIIVIFFLLLPKNNNEEDYVLLLTGNEKITIGLNKEYIEPGYKAYNEKKQDVSKQVVIDNKVDTTKKGEYEVTYSIGNTKKVRYVTVAEIADETFIYLKGEVNAMYLVVGDKYEEPGFEVIDNIDEDLSSKVIISGKVDTSKAGTYRLTYSVVNSRNVTTTVTRTVIVLDEDAKNKK